MKPRILVLMTTYNGERFVREQIDSVLDQAGVEVTLRIRDDVSSDGTWGILEEYAAAHDNIEILRAEENLGIVRNIMGLLYACDADAFDFFAIADQDDVWMPDKLMAAVAAVGEGAVHDPQPTLYYSDVTNVDADGKVIGNEYAPYAACVKERASLLLVQNWCLGCTTLMNGALIKQLQKHPVYDFGRMYDAWIHAVALYCGGRIVADLEHSYICRRITGSNVAGIMNEKRSAIYIVKRVLKWALEKDEQTVYKHTTMAQRLAEEYGDEMDAETRQLVEDVAARERSAAARRRLLKRGDFCMTSPARTAWLRSMLRLNRF